MKLNTHGGARKGAGRPPLKRRQLVKREARPKFSRHHPLHITIKLQSGLPSLRRKRAYQLIRRAIAQTKFIRIIHFAVLSNHIHLLVECDTPKDVGLGMRSLSIRLARGLNSLWNRTGRVFRDRYHLHVLRSLREVRHALIYVLGNYAKHTGVKGAVDPFSSQLALKKRHSLLSISRAREQEVFAGLLGEWRRHYGELLPPARCWMMKRVLEA